MECELRERAGRLSRRLLQSCTRGIFLPRGSLPVLSPCWGCGAFAVHGIEALQSTEVLAEASGGLHKFKKGLDCFLVAEEVRDRVGVVAQLLKEGHPLIVIGRASEEIVNDSFLGCRAGGAAGGLSFAYPVQVRFERDMASAELREQTRLSTW